MMSFTSEEVYSYEGSLEEPVDLYDNGSQMRFRRNVVYIPHVLTPALILEYVPVYVNYQTYDPYLINRFEVAYVPFIRPVSYIHFVPYYSLQATEIISSSAQYEEDIFSNSDSSPDSSVTFGSETSELSFLSEDNDSQLTESTSEVILESTVYGERSIEQTPLDDLQFKDEVHSTTRDFDEISTSSWSSSKSSNQILELPFTPDTSKTSGSQGFIYSEVNDEVFSKYDKEHNIDCKRPEATCSAEDAGRAKEANLSNSSCFHVTVKTDFVDPVNENQVSVGGRRFKMDDDSPYSDDENDGPPITLEEILASDQYWQVKKEEYCEKRRNHELYRSALEGDIRPRKCVPDVGTLATIFEDLPFPVNEPYDDGQDSNVDEFFDLPPLQVKKSESSGSELVPKKKKFRNTRKLFSRLFRCFKQKTVISVKPP